MLSLQRETTEYVYIGVTGDPPATTQEVAFLTAGMRPVENDWTEAVLVDDAMHALWDDASAVAEGDYFVAILIGAFGPDGLELDPGDYVVWLRLTDTVERPVRIAPTALVIE